MEKISWLLNLLEADPLWCIILLFAIICMALVPWRYSSKVEETKDENGNKVYRIFHFFDQ